MKVVEGPKFRLWVDPDISDAEWGEMAHTLCKIIVCGKPQSPKHRRAVAIRQAMAQYRGAPSRRAKELERQYRVYLAGAWLWERDLERLPEFLRTPERVLLHRLARCNAGASLSWRRIFDIATGVSPASRTSADGPGAGEKTLAARL